MLAKIFNMEPATATLRWNFRRRFWIWSTVAAIFLAGEAALFLCWHFRKMSDEPLIFYAPIFTLIAIFGIYRAGWVAPRAFCRPEWFALAFSESMPEIKSAAIRVIENKTIKLGRVLLTADAIRYRGLFRQYSVSTAEIVRVNQNMHTVRRGIYVSREWSAVAIRKSGEEATFPLGEMQARALLRLIRWMHPHIEVGITATQGSY